MNSDLLAGLEHGAKEAEGDTDFSLRAAVQDAVSEMVRGSSDGLEKLDAWLAPYVEAVALRAHTIQDEQVSQLRAAGLSEASVFEITVNAAVAAGLERLDIAMEIWRKR